MADTGAELVSELRDAVAARVPGDVEVRPAPDGFAVGYPEPLVMSGPDGPTATCLWAMVACDPTTLTYRITDVLTGSDVSFFGLNRSAFVFRGRMVGDRRVRERGTRPDGTRDLLRDQVHSPRVLHTAIREPATALGWQEKQPASAIVGKVVAIVAVAGLAVGGVVVGVLVLAGRLG